MIGKQHPQECQMQKEQPLGPKRKQKHVKGTIEATRDVVIRATAYARDDAKRLEMAVSQLNAEATRPSKTVSVTATLDTLLVGGQQAKGLMRKPLVRVGDVDLEESAGETDMCNPIPDIAA